MGIIGHSSSGVIKALNSGTKTSLIISAIAIAIAVLGYWNSNQAIRSSAAWQAEQTPLLQKIVENTKLAEPPTYPAEHTALLKAIADNTTQLQILMQQVRKEEQSSTTEPEPQVD